MTIASGRQATQQLQLNVGDIVIHTAFGRGTVTQLVLDRPNTAWIEFQQFGTKQMSFAMPHDRFFRELNGAPYTPAPPPHPPQVAVPSNAEDPPTRTAPDHQMQPMAETLPIEIPSAATILATAHAAPNLAVSRISPSVGPAEPDAFAAPTPPDLRRALTIGPVYFIAPVENLASILARGLLPLNQRRAGNIHRSIAEPAVQELRDRIYVVDDGRAYDLHDYVPVYFITKTPMLYRRYNVQDQIAYVEINPAVLDLPNVVLSDGNASAQGLHASGTGTVQVSVGRGATEGSVRRYNPRWSGPSGRPMSELYAGPYALGRLPWQAIRAPTWAGSEEIKRQKQAEALIPDRILPGHFQAVHVRLRAALGPAQQAVTAAGLSIPVRTSPQFYFADSPIWNGARPGPSAAGPAYAPAHDEAAWATAMARAEEFEDDDPDYPY